jgi:hypothetical protein
MAEQEKPGNEEWNQHRLHQIVENLHDFVGARCPISAQFFSFD